MQGPSTAVPGRIENQKQQHEPKKQSRACRRQQRGAAGQHSSSVGLAHFRVDRLDVPQERACDESC